MISNNDQAYGIERAKKYNIPTAYICHRRKTREGFDDEVHRILLQHYIDLVVLAGFMRVLTPSFCQKWQGFLVNIHPSLLPLYPGLDTHTKVLADRQLEHGATVHYVIADLDAGPAIIQAKIAVHKQDTAESLKERVHTLEHHIYPHAIGMIERGEIVWEER